ncbi:DUF1549 and DUF1553 domain-containing protein [Haloferula sp. BvORR071]|uniref:DUF1549 and DUF1553 domain-containing protein n=1 Tax=Haloferula sp. BvORR071 TaxID=1396141 RepID=UPI002240EF6E|nr:DUF1549 and DUF1553 domain-containing protein [Haloferula sp. BvORR071]
MPKKFPEVKLTRSHARPGRTALAVASAVAIAAWPHAVISKEPMWSLVPVGHPAVPEGDADVANPIDRFLEVERAAKGLKAVAPADKLTLLRRVHLDLTGLPPSPADQEAFLADTSPDAYQRVVDRLLASDQHGVRYARHWLDVLRYADSDEKLGPGSGIYLWRDWVINALRDDLPYDQFVQLQLTGRRVSERTQMSDTGFRSRKEPRPGDIFALGFLARGAGGDPQDLAINAVDTVSTAFLGLTVGCAKCHDHKFDPVSQVDYYSMKALFDPLVVKKVNLASAQDLVAAGKAMAETQKKRAPFEKELAAFLDPYKTKLREERIQMLPPEVQAVIRKSEKERTVQEQKIADDYFPILRIDNDKIEAAMTAEVIGAYRDLKKRVEEAGRGSSTPELAAFNTVDVDRSREQLKSYVLTSGDPTRPELQNEVKPGWPFAGSEYDFRDGRIEAFADWLTDPSNPFFARVAVNRLWQWHFGLGLQRTPSDFGLQSEGPSHPALLDWLASEFVRQGYSMKQMNRLMVTSQAYRMSSEVPPESMASQHIDPDDTWLWHFRLQRLEAEPIWDSIHAAAGSLDLQVGGRSFDPGAGAQGRRGGDDTAKAGASTKRRAAYMIRGYSPSRDVTPAFLQSFDVDDGRVPCPVRTQTVTAPQSLFLMNSPEIEAATTELAERLKSESGGDMNQAIDLAYRLTIARPPSPAESARAAAYLENNPERLKQLSWLIFNLDEFTYVR